MSGVDRCDQMVSYYSTPRKTFKWYKKVLLHLLDVAVWNTFYIYKKFFQLENLCFKNFRDMLIKELLSVPSNITGDELLLANKNKKGKQKCK